jgi:hypothetical protein
VIQTVDYLADVLVELMAGMTVEKREYLLVDSMVDSTVVTRVGM